MIRSFLALAAAAVLGLALTPGSASACHHKKKATCAHTVVVEPAPCPPPVVVEVVKVKKCGKLFHGKRCCKPAPCPPPVVETCATVSYYQVAPVVAPSAQAPSPQILPAPAAPAKGTPQG